MPNGTAYGFITLKDLFRDRVIADIVPRINTAIQQTVEEHTRQIDSFLAAMVTRTVDHRWKYLLPTTGSLQPLDELGNPKPVQPSGSYDVALPIQGGGTAWGEDRVSRAYATVEDYNNWSLDAIERDTDWMRRHLFGAFLNPTSWTFDDKKYGNLTIQPLANGDATVYVKRGGTAATNTHYLFQLAAIADANNPFPTIYNELDEHPSNTGPYVAYVSTSLRSAVEALTSLIPAKDPTIEYGANITTLGRTLPVDVTKRGDPFDGFGDRFLGKVGGVYVVEWAALPAGYIFARAVGVRDVIGMREHEPAVLRGLFPEYFTPDGNLQVQRFLRYAGFGVLNRVGALMMQIGAGAYSAPAGYTTLPLPA